MDADVTSTRMSAVVQTMANSGDKLVVVVVVAAGTKTGVVVGEITSGTGGKLVHVLSLSGGSSSGSEGESQDGGEGLGDGVHFEECVVGLG